MNHHVAVYNGREVSMDYIANPKDEFKFACQRIIDNGASGVVVCPDGKRYAVSQSNRKAVLLP